MRYGKKGLRPLSQRGLNRIPHNPKQRNFGEGGVKTPGRVLEAFNETLDERQLAPTNGYRVLSVKRGRAQYLIAEIMSGRGRDMRAQARFLREGY